MVFLYNNGLNKKAYPFANRLVRITEDDLAPNEEEYYKSYYVAGCVAFGLEKTEEAFELFFKYLAYAQENFDETWESIRDIYHTIAAYYIRIEDYDNAYAFSCNVVEISEKYPPTTHQGKENLSIYLSIYAHSLKGMGRTDDDAFYQESDAKASDDDEYVAEVEVALLIEPINDFIGIASDGERCGLYDLDGQKFLTEMSYLSVTLSDEGKTDFGYGYIFKCIKEDGSRA